MSPFLRTAWNTPAGPTLVCVILSLFAEKVFARPPSRAHDTYVWLLVAIGIAMFARIVALSKKQPQTTKSPHDPSP